MAAGLSMSDPLSAPSSSASSPASASSSSSSDDAPMVQADLTPTLMSITANSEKKYVYFFEEWANKRAGILKKYTTNAAIPVVANFMEEKLQSEKPVAVDQAKNRVEQLDAQPEQKMQMMSQKEYIYTMETNHDNLRRAWEAGERVQALKIAIQSAKLLSDISVPAFYPSAFVLLTDILDTFGNLVFDRIKQKGMTDAGGKTVALPDRFTPMDVSPDAKETCRNWFYKTACIRELLPRLYIEVALMKCYRFIMPAAEFANLIRRLSRMIRGLGDPLTSLYARAYLCTRARDFCPDEYKELMYETFNDFMYCYKHTRDAQFKNASYIASEKVTVHEYLDICSPATQWLVQVVAFDSNEEIFLAILQQYKECSNSSSMLVHILSAFHPRLIAKFATSMTKLIREADESDVPKSRLYYWLGVAIVHTAPPQEQRLQLLNEVWKVVTKLQNAQEYMEIAQIFVEYLLVHFASRETNILLADVIKHVKKENAYKGLQPQLQIVVSKILQYRTNFDQLLAMDNFMPVLDLLEKDFKFTICKALLESFAKNQKPTSDPVIIQTVFEVARGLHDSIDSLTFDDERRQVGALIIKFIRKIDFGHDLEQQLNLYVECRAAFCNLDAVARELILRVTLLCMRAHRFVKGRHSKKTAAFVKACLAFCHITIPSLDDAFTRLHLFVEAAQVALVNQMMGQSEAFLKAAISLVPDVPPTVERDGKLVNTDALLVGFLTNFASFLLLFPGHPEHGPFHLVKGLLNVVKSFKAWESACEAKTRVYMGILSLFCAYAQAKFPYHIDKVESNDSLYGGEASYVDEMLVFVDKLVEEVLAQLAAIGERGDISVR